ncbi:hypothetical protein [Qipengyuania qiaonensis]|uniref:DUF423 domain-containing protein n=1 Tax=Qipengyuania qiaonensis TaxID=2867240 RepID=A0ABS7J9I6_9SPHN|nr:hypothetical protein [Qipengyuania qiaonensis]MBX7483983.1 hypothetical protein [Qipengyuania qiaonensis]
MSEQLTLSALAAIMSMAAFALIAGLGGFSGGHAEYHVRNGPMAELYAVR